VWLSRERWLLLAAGAVIGSSTFNPSDLNLPLWTALNGSTEGLLLSLLYFGVSWWKMRQWLKAHASRVPTQVMEACTAAGLSPLPTSSSGLRQDIVQVWNSNWLNCVP
jgi:hypothetical protein